MQPLPIERQAIEAVIGDGAVKKALAENAPSGVPAKSSGFTMATPA